MQPRLCEQKGYKGVLECRVYTSNFYMSQKARQAYITHCKLHCLEKMGMVTYLGVNMHTLCVTTVIILQNVTNIMATTHVKRKWDLDCLKSGSGRETKETLTCAVPAHATQMNDHWYEEKGGQPRLFCILGQGVWGLGVRGCSWSGLSGCGGKLCP